MNELHGRVLGFEKHVFPNSSALYGKLASEGQNPKALMISCADSRIVPELILGADPGDLFVTRNAGNIVPPFSEVTGGVSSAVEYAVVALGVRDIIVCGHSDCGAMGALVHPERLEKMPSVAAWLRHAHAASEVAASCYPELTGADRQRALSFENIVLQINHLRTHPSVAAAIARGDLSLHGWFVDIHAGTILTLDGDSGQFVAVQENRPLPIALDSRPRRAAGDSFAVAAE